MLRGLVKAGHEVETVVTKNALRFVGKTSFEALSGNSCHTDLFEDASAVPHVALAKADLILVVPATASFIARLAHGIADDLLLNVLLATTARVVIAPAMHTEMWQHPATTSNISLLKSRGVQVVEPEWGELTSGDVGQGRLAATETILHEALRDSTVGTASISEWVVVTAGGTREPIDEVRYIGNRSSGVQGIELSRYFAKQGFRVTLIGANIGDPMIPGVEFISANTHGEVDSALANVSPDLLVMCAAVSDFNIFPVQGKIKRSGPLHLELIPTKDIVSEYSSTHPNTKVVAFAAEDAIDSELLRLGREKLLRKGVDAIVANPISAIGSRENVGYVISKDSYLAFSGQKDQAARQIVGALRSLNVIA